MVPVPLLGLCPLSCQVLPTPFMSGSIQTTSALAAAHDTKRRGHYTRAVKCALQETAAVALRPLKPRQDGSRGRRQPLAPKGHVGHGGPCGNQGVFRDKPLSLPGPFHFLAENVALHLRLEAGPSHEHRLECI